MSAEIEFRDPPPDGRSSMDWEPIAEALRGRPGEWALVRTKSGASQAGAINNGRVAALRPIGAFRAISRSDGDGTCDIYARYVGETGEHA